MEGLAESGEPASTVASSPSVPEPAEQPRAKAFKIERPARPSRLSWLRRPERKPLAGFRLDVLCLVASLLGFMSLALPWINEGDSSDGDLRGLWYYVQGRGDTGDVNVFALVAGFLIIGSVLALFTRLGGLSLLAGVVSFITISIPSTDSWSIGLYFAVLAASAGILSLLLRRPIQVPRRFLTIGRLEGTNGFELNLLSIMCGVIGLFCFFLPWFTNEWRYPYTGLEFSYEYNLYQFSSGYVASLWSATAGICFLAGSVVAIGSPLGSIGQLVGAAFFFSDMRSNASDFRYYFGWWTNPSVESHFGIGFYLGLACGAVALASMFILWRPAFSGRTASSLSAWSLGAPVGPASQPEPASDRFEGASVIQIIRSSIRPLFVVLVVLALMVAAAVAAYAMPWSHLDVGVGNNDPSRTIHVAIYLDGEGMVVDYIAPSTSYEKSFAVRAGYHRVALDYGMIGGTDGSDVDGTLDWASSIKVRPLRTAMMAIALGYQYSERPVVELTAAPQGNGQKVTVASVNGDVGTWNNWYDFRITLVDGSSNSASWETVGNELSNGSYTEKAFQPVQLGPLTINCTIVDLMGNGRIDIGDYFVLTTGDDYRFSISETYTLYLIHDATSSLSCELSFQGAY